MHLNVIASNTTTSTEALVRLFHQSQLEWSRHLGEETPLDFGRWISNPTLAELPEANALHDAFVLPTVTAVKLIQQMSAISNAAGAPWRSCSINPSQSTNQNATLADALTTAGWTPAPLAIYHRARSVIVAQGAMPSDISVIPARASYRHYRQLLQMRAEEGTEKLSPSPLFSPLFSLPLFSRAEADLLHLDDSHFDVLLALRAGEPVGSIGVLSSGEVGTVREWYVAKAHRNRGIGRLLLSRAMETASRGLLRHVMIGLPEGQLSAKHLVIAAGFETIGRWNHFVYAETAPGPVINAL
jgi:GNAT superfamily N-acetyltransferase